MTESSKVNQLLIEKLTEIIVVNLSNENFGARELAQECGLNRTKLNRKLLSITKKTTHQFIREIRLQKALEILKNEDLTVAEVAYRTGFSTPAYFNTSFHDFFGISPGKMKKGEKELHAETVLYPGKSGSNEQRPARRTVILTIAGIIFFVVLVLQFIYPGHIINLKRSTLGSLRSTDGRISVVVLPFQNITNDTLWDVWRTGIQDIMITTFSDSPDELVTRQTVTINNLIRDKGLASYTSITPIFASRISRRLDANTFIYGSIKQDRSLVRLDAQLTDSRTGEIIKSFQAEGISGVENIIEISKSLSQDIRNYLIISGLKKESYIDFQRTESTASPEAYRYFILGQKAFGERDYTAAIKMFSQAVAIDTSFTYAVLYNALACLYSTRFNEGFEWCIRAYKKRDKMPVYQNIYTNYVYSRFFETPVESIKYLTQLLNIDNQAPQLWHQLSNRYGSLEQYDKAIAASEKLFELYKKMGIKPFSVLDYTLLGVFYNETGQFKKAKKLYRKAEKDFPGNVSIIRRQAILALTEGDTLRADYYIEKYLSIQREKRASDADLKIYLANIYWIAGLLDHAEKYFRESLSLDPDNLQRMNAIAWFLIDTGRDIEEAMEIISKAEKMNPDNFTFLDAKGWALFKQGRYEDALDNLEKVYEKCIIPDLRYVIYLHMEEVKKAISAKKYSLKYTPSLKIRPVTQLGLY